MMRRQEGGTLRGDATASRRNERTSGRHNERTRRGDVTTSWRNKRMRGLEGGAMRGRQEVL